MKRCLSLPKNLGPQTLKYINNRTANNIYLSGDVNKWSQVLSMRSEIICQADIIFYLKMKEEILFPPFLKHHLGEIFEFELIERKTVRHDTIKEFLHTDLINILLTKHLINYTK